MSNTTPISVRMTPAEREIVETAAEQARTNLSDYVRRKAIEAAEADVMERRIVTIAAEDWERFEAWMNSPPRELSKLRKLLTSRPAWNE